MAMPYHCLLPLTLKMDDITDAQLREDATAYYRSIDPEHLITLKEVLEMMRAITLAGDMDALPVGHITLFINSLRAEIRKNQQ